MSVVVRGREDPAYVPGWGPDRRKGYEVPEDCTCVWIGERAPMINAPDPECEVHGEICNPPHPFDT